MGVPSSSVASFLFNIFRLAVFVLTLTLVLHVADVLTLKAGHIFWWVLGDIAAAYLCLITYRAKRKSGHRRAKSDRTPYNTHSPKSDKPVWRNIPGHATLLLDTNVLMCPDDVIRSWFGYLLHNAGKRSWRIVVLGSVYEEIIHHIKRGNADKARDARLARNRIEHLMDELGDAMEIADINQAAQTPTDDRYADPKLIEYMCRHKRTFLFTFDNDLKIRCKQIIRSKQPQNRVFSEEDFYDA